MPQLSDMQIDPKTGLLQNPQDFTPGQLNEASQKGKLTYQAYQQAFPQAAQPANNQADIQAAQQSSPDLRYGTNAAGQPNTAASASPWNNIQQAAQSTANDNAVPPAPGQASNAPQQSQVDPRDYALMALQRGAAVAPHGPGGLTKLDKNYLQDLTNRAGAYSSILDNAVNDQQQSRQAFADNSRAVMEQSTQARQQFQADQQSEQKARMSLMQESKDRDRAIQSQIADLQAQGVDPNRYWNNTSTAGKVAGFIAAGLSSFAAYGLGPKGQQHADVAREMLNDQINRDVEAQKSDLMKNLDLVKTKHAVNSQYFDEQAAVLKAERDSYMSAYNVTMEQVKQHAAMYKNNADVQANATKMIAGLQMNKLEKVDALHDQIYAIQKRNEVANANAAGGQAAAYQKRLDAIRATAKQMVLDSKGQVSEDEALRRATGLELLSGSPQGAKQTTWQENKNAPGAEKQSEELNNMDSAIKGIDSLIAARNKHNGGTLSPNERAGAEAQSMALRAQVGHAFGGRLNPGELEALSAMVPQNPLELNASGILGSDPTMARMQALKQQLQQRRDIFARTPQQVQSGFDPNNPLAFAPRQ